MSYDQTVKNAEYELSVIDPSLGKLIKQHGTIFHKPRTDYFSSLCRSIISQQVSVAAAKAILGRFEGLTSFLPAKVASITEEESKAIGLSRQKSKYLHDLAQHFATQPNVYNHLENLSDEKVIEELTEVKGIGVWTAQMFLMFSLGRMDVFAPKDVGLQRAIKEFYNLDHVPSEEKLSEIADKWRPYRTIASWHLWESLKNTPN